MKLKLFIACMFAGFSVFAQGPYKFTEIKNIKGIDVEDQCATGTCWSFATISFLEAEIIRNGHPVVDLSEMYNVRMTYPLKAESYLRYQGKQQFGPGGLSHDVIAVVKSFGIVPEAAYLGINYNKKEHDHSTLDAILEGTVKTILDKKLNERATDWTYAVNGILDAYLGKAPEQFDYQGKKYTPTQFRDAMGINPDDYVSITSFSHHPFYSKFVLEVPDNWAKGSYYNVPLDEMQQIIDNAITTGYTIAWDADVSEKGFSFSNGLALVPEKTIAKEDMFTSMITERVIDQAIRQKAFDSQETTDDHLMHITGMAKDQNGVVYYITKNSWGSNNPFSGYQYVSSSYLRYKTVGIVVHKNAIPAALKAKMGIK
jgi:bleomycin hydrolase